MLMGHTTKREHHIFLPNKFNHILIKKKAIGHEVNILSKVLAAFCLAN